MNNKNKSISEQNNKILATPKNVTKNDGIGKKTKQGIVWTTLFQSIQFGIRFSGSIILARLLFPEDFGLMGIASIVIQLARRITNFGFNMVLVQRKEIRKEHYETVFTCNLFLMSLLIALLFFNASYIAEFFGNEKIRLIILVLGFDFMLKALSGVPLAILRRNMKFKEIEKARTCRGFIAIISSIGLAFAGFGVWALVIGDLLGSVTILVMVTMTTKWVPKLKFYLWALKDVFSFGIWVYIDSYISYAINKIDFFTIGKFLSVTQLGFYERAFNLMSLPRKQIGRKINYVLFSAYSRIQDDQERTVRGMLRVITFFSLITYPLMTWMFFVAPSLITIIYGSKWLNSIYPLQIMCLAGIVDTFTLILGPTLLAQGLVGQRTRRKFVYLVILGSSVLVGSRWGIKGVAWGVTFGSIFQLGLLLRLTILHLPISLAKFVNAQKSAVVYSLIQAITLVGLRYFTKSYFSNTSWEMLVCASLLSGSVFILSHFIFRFKDIDTIVQEIYKDVRKSINQIPLVNRLF